MSPDCTHPRQGACNVRFGSCAHGSEDRRPQWRRACTEAVHGINSGLQSRAAMSGFVLPVELFYRCWHTPWISCESGSVKTGRRVHLHVTGIRMDSEYGQETENMDMVQARTFT